MIQNYLNIERVKISKSKSLALLFFSHAAFLSLSASSRQRLFEYPEEPSKIGNKVVPRANCEFLVSKCALKLVLVVLNLPPFQNMFIFEFSNFPFA